MTRADFCVIQKVAWNTTSQRISNFEFEASSIFFSSVWNGKIDKIRVKIGVIANVNFAAVIFRIRVANEGILKMEILVLKSLVRICS